MTYCCPSLVQWPRYIYFGRGHTLVTRGNISEHYTLVVILSTGHPFNLPSSEDLHALGHTTDPGSVIGLQLQALPLAQLISMMKRRLLVHEH